MGTHENNSANIDPQALAHAKGTWGHFTQAIKYGVATVIVLLLGMALFLA